MSNAEDQQFCLRWNNFQANITSQFETLRDDEDFVDVTLACEGQRLEAHKVVLSACSPFFKELFKSNPCPHPIIFMRDVEARHIIALLEFMYAGEVNVSQAHLSGFLRTAESLQIRGLTDASKAHKVQPKSTDGQEQSMCNVQQSQSNRSLVNKSNLCTTSTKSLSPQPNIKSLKSEHSTTKQHLNVSSIETTVTDEKSQKSNKNPSPSSSPTPAKRQCKETITENILSENNRLDDKTESEDVPQKSSGNMNINPFATLHQTQFRDVHSELDLEADIVEPKVELPDYASDEEIRAESRMTESILGLDGPDTDQLSNIRGGMDILSGSSSLNIAEMSQESLQAAMTSDPRKPHCLDPQPCPVCGRVYSNMSNLRQHMRLIHHPQNVTCPLCSKQFKTSLYLKRHLVGYHNTAVEPGTTNISLPQNVTDIKHNIYNKPPARTDNLNIGFHGSNQNFNVSSSQNVMEIKETVYGKKIDSNVGYQNNRNDTKISSSNNSDIGVFPNNHNLNLESMQTHNFECKDGNIGGYHQNTPRYNTNNFELQTNQTDMTESTF